ncbi:MAG: GTP-binding protein [Desulfobacterales bacterium]|jgi:G3E family GTPase
MSKPKKLDIKKPVKLIFAGGFLGSGKTTALAELAKRSILQGMKVGIITNDQSENLADTVIVRELLTKLEVPVEEVVKGCFCCKFDELIDHMEKILAHDPDLMLGEPVGSCTDFVAAVANPIKIHYRQAFTFAPFSTMVDPDRVRELLLGETETNFPEEVSYLFHKQLEEADIIVLNKIDLLDDQEINRLCVALKEKFDQKEVMAISAKKGDGMEKWLDILLSGRPGANTVLRQIDYDRYATAEAVLGWLNAAVKIKSPEPFESGELLYTLASTFQEAFKRKDAEIGHLKLVFTSGGKSIWGNVTHLAGQPAISGKSLGQLSNGTLIVNARVRIEPNELETIVRNSLAKISTEKKISSEIDDLQCFSPAYPEPPHMIREVIQ